MVITELFTIENNYKCFDFKKCLKYLDEQGKQKFGPHFKIRQDDSPIIYKLLIYAIQDKENCEAHNINLRKGILLLGPVGSGKTSLMTIILPFFTIENHYSIKPTREITYEFVNKGYPTILKYGKSETIFCFDDLGVEKNINLFGNDCNTMAEILLCRYDKFAKKGTITHATTNLNSQELEKIYGDRVRSRLREMFNLIAFDKSIPDKRQ